MTTLNSLTRIRTNPLGLGWFALMVAAAIPVYWLGFQSLGRAWITPEYSHGPLIPMISLYLFLRELRHAPPAAPGTPANRTPGIALMLFALAFGIFGNLIRIPDEFTLVLPEEGLKLLCHVVWRREIDLLICAKRHGVVCRDVMRHAQGTAESKSERMTCPSHERITSGTTTLI